MALDDIYNNRGGRLPRPLRVGVSFAESGGGQGGGGGGDVGGDQGGFEGATLNAFTLENIEPSGSTNARANAPYQMLAIFDAGEFDPSDYPVIVQETDSGGGTVEIQHATQSDVITTHSDGSAHTVVLSAIMPANLTQGQTVDCRIDRVGNNAAGTVITKSDILASNADMRVQVTIGGTVYSATLKEALTATTIAAKHIWREGALCTEYKDIWMQLEDSGSTQHPHLHARFQIAGFWDGQAAAATVTDARIRCTIENTRLYEDINGASNTFQKFTASNITMEITDSGGTFNRTVVNENSVEIPRQGRITRYGFWSATGSIGKLACHQLPQQAITQRLIFNFGNVVASGTKKTGYESGADNRTLNDLMSLRSNMTSGGNDATIGPMVEWMNLYFANAANRGRELFVSIEAHSEQAGLYHWAFRDENTDEPVKRTDWPYFGLIGSFNDHNNPSTGLNEAPPNHSGDNQLNGSLTGVSVGASHIPQVHIGAYILTGDYYHLEQQQFVAAWAVSHTNPAQTYSGAEKALYWRTQHRSRGWIGLNLFWAWVFSSSGSKKNYFKLILDNNREFTYEVYTLLNRLLAPNGVYSQNGLHKETVNHAGSPTEQRTLSMWMALFELLHINAMSYHDEEWQHIVDWAMRLWSKMITTPDFCPRIMSGYRIGLNPTSEGITKQDHKYMRSQTLPDTSGGCPTAHTNTEAESYGGILKGALALLAERGYANALAEYNELTSQMSGENFADFNNFNIVPISTDSTERAMPFDSTPFGEFYDYDDLVVSRLSDAVDSNGDSESITDFSSWVYDTKRDKILEFGAGHDSAGQDNGTYNGVKGFNVKTGLYEIVHGASVLANRPSNVRINPDNTAAARHTYQAMCYIPAPYDYVLIGGAFRYVDSGGTDVMIFRPGLAQGDSPANPSAPWSVPAQPPKTAFMFVWDDAEQVVWAQHDNGISYYRPSTNTWSALQHDNAPATSRSRQTFMIDPIERRLWMVGNGIRTEYDISDIDSTVRDGSPTFTNEGGLFDIGEPGIHYHAGIRKNVICQPEHHQTNFYLFDGATRTISAHPVQVGNSVSLENNPTSSGFWRLAFSENFDTFFVRVNNNSSVKARRFAQF